MGGGVDAALGSALSGRTSEAFLVLRGKKFTGATVL